MDTKDNTLNIQLNQSLEDEVPKSQQQNDLKSEFADRSKNEEKDLIKNVNNKVLIEYLSPEVSKNERSKRLHKYILIILMVIFLTIQFKSVYTITIEVINYAISKEANIDIVNSLLTFVSAYITSVVVELIAILRYIVKNVFDTSIAELVKIFKETDNKIKEQDT